MSVPSHLQNNFVKRTITQAIQQKLCNQSNEDLLNVIFKSFELTLLSVNVEQISLNVSECGHALKRVSPHHWHTMHRLMTDQILFAGNLFECNIGISSESD